MKPRTRRILLWTSIALTVGYIFVTLIVLPYLQNKQVCSSVVYTFTENSNVRYLDSAEIEFYLRERQLYPLGQPLHKIRCQQIEDALSQHPLIETVECYVTQDGVVKIPMELRQPLYRVLTADTTYFVDVHHHPMAYRSSIQDTLLIVRGCVSESMSTNELCHLVEWLNEHPEYKAEIDYIEVDAQDQIRLIEKESGCRLLIGNTEGLDDKIRRLHRLYNKGASIIADKNYTEYDLRFQDQVIGRTKGTSHGKENKKQANQ